jgi:hypothetical protein
MDHTSELDSLQVQSVSDDPHTLIITFLIDPPAWCAPSFHRCPGALTPCSAAPRRTTRASSAAPRAPRTRPAAAKIVRALSGRLSGRSLLSCKSGFYGAFVWACRAPNSQTGRFHGAGRLPERLGERALPNDSARRLHEHPDDVVLHPRHHHHRRMCVAPRSMQSDPCVYARLELTGGCTDGDHFPVTLYGQMCCMLCMFCGACAPKTHRANTETCKLETIHAHRRCAQGYWCWACRWS